MDFSELLNSTSLRTHNSSSNGQKQGSKSVPQNFPIIPLLSSNTVDNSSTESFSIESDNSINEQPKKKVPVVKSPIKKKTRVKIGEQIFPMINQSEAQILTKGKPKEAPVKDIVIKLQTSNDMPILREEWNRINETIQNLVEIQANIKDNEDYKIPEKQLKLINNNFKLVQISTTESNTETNNIIKIFKSLYESILPPSFQFVYLIQECGNYTVYKNDKRLFIRFKSSKTGFKFEFDLDNDYKYYAHRTDNYLVLFAQTDDSKNVSPLRDNNLGSDVFNQVSSDNDDSSNSSKCNVI